MNALPVGENQWLPLAAGTAVAEPDRPVILLDGDGCAVVAPKGVISDDWL